MKKRNDDLLDDEADVANSSPVSMRRDLRGGATRGRKVRRRKPVGARRKASKPGGIHQRANKRSNW